MLRWAVRYMVIAVVVAAAFAALHGRAARQFEVAARDAAGERADRYARGATRDHGRGDSGDVEQVIEPGPHGHFLVEASVNGVPIDFMVDTGASEIVLSPRDARQLGFTPDQLRFTQEFESANGTVRAAPVELRELRIGQFQLFDLEASVNEAPLPISLLGMSFLRRLSSYEVADGRLILRW
ncbi:MAG TPA: TIGR02281 family clan AA aspartic protease [Geminicoccaceae bacterium]|nr:TIGR02281 family clan AA aspartic protease [Geminicoccaceae bacterium]